MRVKGGAGNSKNGEATSKDVVKDPRADEDKDPKDPPANSKAGDPKFIPECTLPLTGRNVVDMIITELCVFQRPDHDSPFKLIECAPGVTPDDVAAKTTAHYIN